MTFKKTLAALVDAACEPANKEGLMALPLTGLPLTDLALAGGGGGKKHTKDLAQAPADQPYSQLRLSVENVKPVQWEDKANATFHQELLLFLLGLWKYFLFLFFLVVDLGT